MKKILHVAFPPPCIMSPEQKGEADRLFDEALRRMGHRYAITQCFYEQKPLSSTWVVKGSQCSYQERPGCPIWSAKGTKSHGLLMLMTFPPEIRLCLEARYTIPLQNREDRPIPVLSFNASAESLSIPRTNYSNICVGVMTHLYEFHYWDRKDLGVFDQALEYFEKRPVPD